MNCCRLGLRSIALVLFLAQNAPTLAGVAVHVVETRTVPASALPITPGASHALRLYVYSFVGTRWSAAEILPAVIESARLLAPCGVALTRADLQVLEAPREFHFYFTPVSRELLQAIAVLKPALFFVEDTHNRPAFDAEAIGLGNAGPRPELANTIWVAYGARDLPYALAHELVHVLSDSGEHSTEPDNLMQPETSPRNARLTETQCERLRSRGVVNGLLEPR